MANTEPFEQLVGRLKVYVAPVGETPPAVNATPAGNWVEMGATEGEQSIQHGGALTYFYDNDHQGPVKAVRPQEDVVVAFTLVGLTLEHYARVLDQVSNVTSDAGPPATKRTPLKRGATPNEYALLFTGEAMSPYGGYPGMYVIPRGVFDGEPQPVYSAEGRASLECEFHALEDDDQSDADRLGWLVVQTA
jgi:hypothetical protein